MTIRVLLADDHEIVRSGLREMLEKREEMTVVGEAADGRQAVSAAIELHPDVAVVDIGMPELNGIDAIRQITRDAGTTHTVALSMHKDHRFVSESFAAGARAYLVKDCAFDELASAIQVVCRGQTYVSPSIAGALMADYVDRLDAPRPLTPREREVLQLVAEGSSTKEVAYALHVSVKTVETHRRQIMNKIDVHSVAGLVKYAIREGITGADT